MNFIKLLAAATTLATGAFGEYGRAFAIGPSWDRRHPACLDFITNPIDLFVTSHPLPWQPCAAAFEQTQPFNPPGPFEPTSTLPATRTILTTRGPFGSLTRRSPKTQASVKDPRHLKGEMMKTVAVSFSALATIMFVLANVGIPLADTFRPVVRGKRGAVAAGTPLAAEAGLRLLEQGGNAVDAGCAAILAASVIEFSHFTFGGEVPIIIKPKTGDPVVINGQGTAPRLATREFFLERAKKPADPNEPVYRGAPEYVSIAAAGAKPGLIPSTGILPATVPGVLDAVVTALDKLGTRTLGQVMQPAIELADGFPIDELRVEYIEKTRKIFERWPTAVRLYLPGGAAKTWRYVPATGPGPHAPPDCSGGTGCRDESR